MSDQMPVMPPPPRPALVLNLSLPMVNGGTIIPQPLWMESQLKDYAQQHALQFERAAASLALERAELAAEVESLRLENFKLAAGQCANVVGDEGGTPQCKRIAELSAGLADACELLQGWIAAKCPPRYRSEHLAHVEKLRGLLGPNR
jgi:hypothetical protein